MNNCIVHCCLITASWFLDVAQAAQHQLAMFTCLATILYCLIIVSETLAVSFKHPSSIVHLIYSTF